MRIMAKQVTGRVSIIKPSGDFSMGVVKKAVRDWTIRDHRKQLDSLSGLKQVKALIQGPSAKETRKEESVTHILCDCEATAYPRFCHIGHYFMELSNYHDTPMRKVLRFIRSVGLTKG
jgi:hypothetical protein